MSKVQEKIAEQNEQKERQEILDHHITQWMIIAKLYSEHCQQQDAGKKKAKVYKEAIAENSKKRRLL